MSVFLPSSHKFAIACGAGGAYVEVTDWVVFNEGAVTRSWGRQSAFSDATPSTFSFTLDNRDGRFTPGYATGIAPVVIPLSEGMGVSWELNGQLRHGQIRSMPLVFPDVGVASSLRVRVVVSDSLTVAARTSIDTLADTARTNAGSLLFWPLDDSSGSRRALEASANDSLVARGSVTFGEPGIPMVSESMVRLESAGGSTAELAAYTPAVAPILYPDADVGAWGFWASYSGVGNAQVSVNTKASAFYPMIVGIYPDQVRFSTNSSAATLSLDTSIPHYYSWTTAAVFASGNWRITIRGYVDGVLVGGANTTPLTNPTFTQEQRQVKSVILSVDNGDGVAYFSRLSHTATLPNEAVANTNTEGSRLTGIASLVPLNLDTLPTDLGNELVGEQGSGSALDLINEIIRGEQGHIYTTVAGTLLAPVEKVTVRSRVRPETVTTTFVTTADILDSPDIGRDTTNTVSAVNVNGSDNRIQVTNSDLEPLVGSANTSGSLAFSDIVNLRAWGEDRILRGVNKGIDVFSITVNARSTTASRWADLLALTPGYRYRVSGLPTAQLGISTWDGWFLGAAETHTQEDNLFTLYFERTLPKTGIFDTDRWMADGALTLSANVNAAVTSMSIATSDPLTKFTTTGGDLPVDVVMGTEQMRVTAVTGATPQVFTIVRGVNGTTATTHVAGETLELTPETLFAY